MILNSDTRVGRQPDNQATPYPRRLSGSIPDRPSRTSHSILLRSTTGLLTEQGAAGIRLVEAGLHRGTGAACSPYRAPKAARLLRSERVQTPRADCTRVVDGPGSQARAWSPPGIRLPRISAMASSRGDVRSSPMAYPAERPLPKLPLPARPETRTTTTGYYTPRIGLTELINHHRPPTTPPRAVG